MLTFTTRWWRSLSQPWTRSWISKSLWSDSAFIPTPCLDFSTTNSRSLSTKWVSLSFVNQLTSTSQVLTKSSVTGRRTTCTISAEWPLVGTRSTNVSPTFTWFAKPISTRRTSALRMICSSIDAPATRPHTARSPSSSLPNSSQWGTPRWIQAKRISLSLNKWRLKTSLLLVRLRSKTLMSSSPSGLKKFLSTRRMNPKWHPSLSWRKWSRMPISLWAALKTRHVVCFKTHACWIKPIKRPSEWRLGLSQSQMT